MFFLSLLYLILLGALIVIEVDIPRVTELAALEAGIDPGLLQRMAVAADDGSIELLTLQRFDPAGIQLAANEIGGYIIVVVMTPFAPPEIVGIAYDSGGVTTSTITVPLVTAFGVGLAHSIRGRNPMIDGFGLIAFASLTPMIFVMAFGMLWQLVG